MNGQRYSLTIPANGNLVAAHFVLVENAIAFH
jgi:hypothetical protein